MPLGWGGRVNSVGWGGEKNRESVRAPLCLAFTELVAPATATPIWSKLQQSSSERGRAHPWEDFPSCVSISTPRCVFKRYATQILSTPALSETLYRFLVKMYLFFSSTEITSGYFTRTFDRDLRIKALNKKLPFMQVSFATSYLRRNAIISSFLFSLIIVQFTSIKSSDHFSLV